MQNKYYDKINWNNLLKEIQNQAEKKDKNQTEKNNSFTVHMGIIKEVVGPKFFRIVR